MIPGNEEDAPEPGFFQNTDDLKVAKKMREF